MSSLGSKEEPLILKVVFIGDSGVGKTSLLRREAEDTFSKEHLATIGVDFRIKTYQIGKVTAKVQLWDTAGQERFRSIQKPYYKNSSAICLCFSLNDRQSFDHLSHWVDEIRNYDVQGTIYLIGCKSDLEAQVPTDEVIVFAEAHQIHYLQTSAKDSQGVNQGFKRIVEESVQSKLLEMVIAKEPQKKDNEKLKQEPFFKKKGCC